MHTAVYEGPFDLLLHLIVRDQVDVYQVSLSRIVDAYLAEMDRMGALDLDAATEFLLIAATLVELKTRRLLPGVDDPEAEEELALLEERDLLLARLLECKTFRDAGLALARAAQLAGLSWPRTVGLGATRPKPQPRVDLDHVAPIRASVSDAVDELASALPALGRASFRRLTRGVEPRLEVIVRFLAVLELYKQGRVELEQAEAFGELVVIWTGEGADAPVTSDIGEDIGADGEDIGEDIGEDELVANGG